MPPKARLSDIILAVLVIAVTAMLLIPLPTPLLDVLIVTNICFAVLLLLVGLYMPNALAMLAFPSLLLLTTLFRLSLNVASSRLILSQGDAGTVIHAFGTFLIRGEIVVGVIIFTIVTIVNFIVIARGSSRVSEVAARFVLDALPGKQMAIDSDLRAGLLTAESARNKREDLRKESQLYGSMDGAMKFVQGDAIAGIFIILTNIIGGLYMGVSQGMSFGDAVQTYTVLTVGDGLVSQIPALLISICAGIVVTRVSASENSTLGADLGAQLFSRPGAVLFSGALLAVLGLLPGLPKIPFLSVGILFMVGGYLLRRFPLGTPMVLGGKGELMGVGGAQTLLLGGGTTEDELEGSHVVVFLDAGALYKLYRVSSQRYHAWWHQFQNDFYQEVGLRLPELSVQPDEFLPSSSYEVKFGGVTIAEGSLLLDTVLVEANPDAAEILGVEIAKESFHPMTGNRVFWATQTPGLGRIVEAAGIRTYDFLEYIGLTIGVFFNNAPEEIFSSSDVYSLIKQLEKRHPGLVSEAFNKDFINVSSLTELFHELVREGINVRDFRQILESVSAYCSAHRVTLSDDADLNLHELVSFVRESRRRQFVGGLLSGRKTLKVFTLSDPVEDLLGEASVDSRTLSLGLDPDSFDRLKGGLDLILGPLRDRGILPVSILCRSEIRHKIVGFLRQCGSALRVVSIDELEPSVRIEQVGVWAV